MKDHPISTKMMIAANPRQSTTLFQCGNPAAAMREERAQALLSSRPYTRPSKKETAIAQEKSQLRAWYSQ
jgi:hypothetical protein